MVCSSGIRDQGVPSLHQYNGDLLSCGMWGPAIKRSFDILLEVLHTGRSGGYLCMESRKHDQHHPSGWDRAPRAG